MNTISANQHIASQPLCSQADQALILNFVRSAPSFPYQHNQNLHSRLFFIRGEISNVEHFIRNAFGRSNPFRNAKDSSGRGLSHCARRENKTPDRKGGQGNRFKGLQPYTPLLVRASRCEASPSGYGEKQNSTAHKFIYEAGGR